MKKPNTGTILGGIGLIASAAALITSLLGSKKSNASEKNEETVEDAEVVDNN